MNDKITVSTLIMGSNRINEMRSQIQRLVSVTLSLICNEDLKGRKFAEEIFKFTEDGLVWQLIHYNKSLSCQIRHENSRYEDARLNQYEVDSPYWLIKQIHAGLERFLSEMIAHFPQLKERVAPFIEVAAS
ncbi:MAG: hypothetical protein V1668_01605 [Patescibacteria group bacterium]